MLRTRREVLRASLAAGAALALGGCERRRPPAAKALRVVVVGGGLAGLACADALLSGGAEATVIEARRRVGGRVVSIADLVPGKIIEGGGEFIGANHPTWLALAKRFGLALRPVGESDAPAPLVIDGRRVDPAAADAAFRGVDHLTAALTSMARGIHADEPWRSENAAALDGTSVAQWLDERGVDPLARRVADTLLSADNGVPTSRQSLLGLLSIVRGGGLEAYWTASEAFRCEGGNARLAEALAATLGGRLQTGAAARGVMSAGRRLIVELVDNRRIEADRVVVAVSPAVWNRLIFQPPLPPDLLPQTGTNVKHVVRLAAPVWRVDGLSPEGVSDGAAQLTWDATDGQPGDGWAMTAFSGAAAADAALAWSVLERDGRYRDELTRLYPSLPEHARETRFMNWPDDELTRCSYSFPAPGEVCGVAPRLRSGVNGLRFAGEHCSTAFTGYMEGALSSGIAVARAILQEA